ncbi:MAG: tryptophan-rich sensory protein [Cyanobacteria bacterium J06607_13]
MGDAVQNSMGQIGRQWLTVVAVVMAIAVNALSNFFPPAGQNIGQISNTTFSDVLITPAGYAFAIWGLIYIGLIAFSLYQALPAQRQQADIAQAAQWLIGACLLQMVWVYVFLLSLFWLSVVLMFGILFCLANAYLRTRAETVVPRRKNRWLFQAPFSVYFGWITVAALVNVASALTVTVQAGSAALSMGAIAWTIVMMTISAGIAATVALRYDDAAFPMVAVWALCAIAVRQSAVVPIAFVGIALSVGLVCIIVRVQGVARRSRREPSSPT